MPRASHTVLIIDDDPEVTRAVRLTITLQEPTWRVIEAHRGDQGLDQIGTGAADLVLLDLSMPDMHGFDVLEQIRLFSNLPVIILTVQDDELDTVRGLQLGADDYVVKPFGHLELMARIRSVLRRSEGTPGPALAPFSTGALHIDFERRVVTVGGEVVKLTKTEFRLLEVLAHNAGRIIPDSLLQQRVWGPDLVEFDHLKVFVYRLR
ncbi:MAG: response regulator transcription factor, partial [Roseiflexaceae bacterium]|nr:response regulator transcription factor [Roseiflexaceae bacterium]